MASKFKRNGRALSIPAGLGIGLLISLVLTFAGAAALSHLIGTEKVGEGAMGYGIMIILAIATAMGAWGATSFIKKMYLQISLMAGGCYYLALLAITALFFGGQYQGMGVTAIIVVISCLAVAFIPRKNGNPFKMRKKAYR